MCTMGTQRLCKEKGHVVTKMTKINKIKTNIGDNN
jgi:hypothetical protein